MHHVRLAFSSELGDVGKFRLGKVCHLVFVICRILYKRFRHRCTVLYYPPGGEALVPACRDVLILLLVRWAFRHTVLHFHAGGVSALVDRMPSGLKQLFRIAYGEADCAIHTSPMAPEDGRYFDAATSVVIPCGVADVLPDYEQVSETRHEKPRLLFVGAVRPEKGVTSLLEACSLLHKRGLSFEMYIVGSFVSASFEKEMRLFVREHNLENVVHFTGPKTGESKWRLYASSDVFCFPSFYKSEFGLVLLEAMQFKLPIVGTTLGGVPSVVIDTKTGYLVPPDEYSAIANRIETLLRNPDLAREMGKEGRRVFLDMFALDRYQKRMNAVMTLVGAGAEPHEIISASQTGDIKSSSQVTRPSP